MQSMFSMINQCILDLYLYGSYAALLT